jgi:quinol monooxygenase YgiN
MPLYIFASFEPGAGKQRELIDELRLVVEATRAEAGCVRIHLYESTRDPRAYFIHSEWIDEQAFEAHTELPHTKRFLSVIDGLIAHPLDVVRTKRIG